MAHPRKFLHPLQVKLRPLDRSLVRYYAECFKYDQARIVRSMIRRYAQADHSLDVARFKKWVDEVVMPEHEGDKELQEVLQHEVELFVAERKKK